MRVTIGAQMISIAASALGGLLAGLLYDLFRVLRRGGGRLLGVVCDLVFCLFCTGEMFVTGMVFCGGRPGFWEPFFFLGVFGLYIFGVSPSVTPFFGICREKCAVFLKKRKKNMK
ncbi:MAG: hypothetical protein IJH48_08055 [Oscillospiraceae bacterium]|nr:hypothetical protein [Oscillospiraceae bacterium]